MKLSLWEDLTDQIGHPVGLGKNFTYYTMHLLFQPYFCGMDVECPTHNSRWALNRAIENVERHFPVVGVLEDLHVTLQLMQKALPTFFPGIWDAYRQHIRKWTMDRAPQKSASKVASAMLLVNVVLVPATEASEAGYPGGSGT